MMTQKGYVHKYGDNVDTDIILPGAYRVSYTPLTLPTILLG